MNDEINYEEIYTELCEHFYGDGISFTFYKEEKTFQIYAEDVPQKWNHKYIKPVKVEFKNELKNDIEMFLSNYTVHWESSDTFKITE